jgi:hypothetical protein
MRLAVNVSRIGYVINTFKSRNHGRDQLGYGCEGIGYEEDWIYLLRSEVFPAVRVVMFYVLAPRKLAGTCLHFGENIVSASSGLKLLRTLASLDGSVRRQSPEK